MDETDPKFDPQNLSEHDRQMEEVPTFSPGKKAEGPVSPELLSDTDFLGLEPKLREMGYLVSVYRDARKLPSCTVIMGVPESLLPETEGWKPIISFPHVSRSLSLTPTSDKTPERKPDKGVKIGGFKHFATWMWDEWITNNIGASTLETYIDEGIISHYTDENARANYSLPTRKMNRPSYLAGDAHNPWLEGGGTLAVGISPVMVNCWFTRANPNFCQYLEHTRDKLEGISEDEIVRYHMDIAERYGIVLDVKKLKEMADRYCNTELPIIRRSIQDLLKGKEDICLPPDRNRLSGFEDGIWLFSSTTKPVLPLSFIANEPSPEMNTKYETAMMKELDDPEASKLNWLDIATAFSVECGPAKTTYLSVDPEVWEEKCTELVAEHEAEKIEEKQFAAALKELPQSVLDNLRKFSPNLVGRPWRKSESEAMGAIFRHWKSKGKMPDLSMLEDVSFLRE